MFQMKKHYKAKWFIDEYFKNNVENSLSKDDLDKVKNETKDGLEEYWKALNITNENVKLELLVIAVIASYEYIETEFEEYLKERFGEA